MEIEAGMVKELRNKTNAGFMDCKTALQETQGDINKAIDLLRKRGVAVAEKKAGRTAKEGVIASYIHIGGKIGVLVEINCETDFVARNQVFKDFAKDITLQIASAKPKYIGRKDVPQESLEKEKEIYRAQIKNKPDNVIEKILSGKLEKYYSEVCLLEQVFVKPPNDKAIKQLLTDKIAELGENIVIKRFTRYELGENGV